MNILDPNTILSVAAAIVIGIFAFYVLIRLATKAIFKSYFEERINNMKNFLKGDKKNGKEV